MMTEIGRINFGPIDEYNGTADNASKQYIVGNKIFYATKSDTQNQDALSKQVGGSHYKQYKIQPYEFFIKNQIPHHKAAIIRRILIYDHPTGKGMEDVQKIKHEVDLIIQLENWEEIDSAKQFKEKTCKCND